MGYKRKYSTLKDVVKISAKELGEDKETVEKIAQTYFDKIVEYLAKGYSVRLSDFGSFELTTWNADQIFDINTGAKKQMQLKTVRFKPSKVFRKKLLEQDH